MEKGLVHLYCGDGKGKTTAAFGLVLRAYGRGQKILVCQMLKSGDSGEILAIQKNLPGIDIIEDYPLSRFLFALSEKEKTEEIEKQRKKFNLFYDRVMKGNYDMALLDEACAACAYGAIPPAMLQDLVRSKPEKTELILTGRDPKPELTALAHYISEIKKIRHPYDQGMGAREGVEK